MLKKPSQFFNGDDSSSSGNNSKNFDVNSPAYKAFKENVGKINAIADINETLEIYRKSIDEVNFLSEEVGSIRAEIQSLLTTEDLDNALMGQFVLVDQTISDVQDKIKKVNDSKISKIRESVNTVLESVNSFLDTEVPKYKKLFVDSEKRFDRKHQELEEKVNQNIESSVDSIEESLQEKYNSLSSSISGLNKDNLDSINERIDEKIEEFEKVKKSFARQKNYTDEYREDVEQKIKDLQMQILRNESDIRIETSDLYQIKKVVNSAIKQLNIEEIQQSFEEKNHRLLNKVKYIEEVLTKFDEKKLLTETILTEPPSLKNSDPLTPLDQSYVTLEDLQQHYRLFVNRIQQQLSSLGGGGETQLKFLDDVIQESVTRDGALVSYASTQNRFVGAPNITVGVGTTALLVEGNTRITGILTVGNSSLTLDGDENKVQVGAALTLGHTTGLQYHSQNLHIGGFDVNNVNVSGVVTSSSIVATSASITSFEVTDINTSGIVTANHFSGVSASFSGNVSIAGTLTYDDVTNIDSIGLITARSGIVATGIVTATTFEGSGASLTSIPTSALVGLATDADKLDGQQGTYYLDYANFSGIATDSDKLDGEQGTYYLDYANFSGIATDADKLDGEQGTYYLDYSNFSGIATDADKLDGEQGTYYLDYSNFSGIATDSDKLDGQQGTYYLDYANFSGIATDADKLDGQQGTYYLDYSNFSGIATDSDKLDGQQGTYYLDYSNFSGIATDADKLDGQQGTYYLDYNNFSNTPTIPTDNSELANGAGYATEAFVGLATAGLASEAFVGLATAGLASEAFVGLATAGLASEAFVGLATAGLASEAFVGLATAGLASEAFVGLATAGLASEAFVGLATAGLASEAFVGLATVGLLTATASGASLTDLTGASAGTFGATSETPVITVDANGRITGITTAAISSGGLSAVVDDTAPQLGGNLDVNSKVIEGTGGVNVTGVITATSYVGSGANLTDLTGASAGTFGATSETPVITVDANGKITGITTAAISGGGGGSSTLAGLSDVTITSPSTNQVLLWNGANWVNATSPGGGGGISEALAIAYAIAL